MSDNELRQQVALGAFGWVAMLVVLALVWPSWAWLVVAWFVSSATALFAGMAWDELRARRR